MAMKTYKNLRPSCFAAGKNKTSTKGYAMVSTLKFREFKGCILIKGLLHFQVTPWLKL